jgi:hypothetical protein
VTLLTAAGGRDLVRRGGSSERDFDVDAAFPVQQERFVPVPAISCELRLSVGGAEHAGFDRASSPRKVLKSSVFLE